MMLSNDLTLNNPAEVNKITELYILIELILKLFIAILIFAGVPLFTVLLSLLSDDARLHLPFNESTTTSAPVADAKGIAEQTVHNKNRAP